jgi:predicted Zn-dependent peptidase
MEDTRAVSDWMGAQELLTGRVRTVEQTVALIDGVTTADTRRVARDLLREDSLNLAVVGPFKSTKRFESLLHL